MKRRDLIAGTSIALGAVVLQGTHHNAKATSGAKTATTFEKRGWLRQVALTSAQATALQEINQKFAVSLATQKQVVKRAATELRRLKRSANADATQLKTQEKRQARALQNYEAILGAKCFACSEVLTAQQRQQVTRTLAKHLGSPSYVATILAT